MGDSGMASPTMDNEHFPSFEERARSSTRMVAKSGRASPTQSASGSLIRNSIIKLQEAKKARKVRFYRNGDRFFKGIIYAVSPERFRTFEALMAELTSSPLGDNKVLPNGVRHVFSLDGSMKVTSINDLEDGQSYVCASTSIFKQMNYPNSNNPSWNPNIATDRSNSPISRQPSRQSNYSRSGTPAMGDEERDYIRPKLITIIASGSKPRRAVRILMNKKTVHSFEQVMGDVSEAIKLDSGNVRRLYSMNGKPVNSLQDFFLEESVFIAYGNERQAYDDFDLGENEVRFVSAYRSVRQKERITLRTPKAPRRLVPLGNYNQNAAGTVGKLASLRFKTTTGGGNKSVTGSPHKSPVKTPATVVKLKMMEGADEGAADVILDAPKELTSKYKVGKLIGEGNFASVRECYDKAKRRPFALKIIDKEKCRGKEHMIVNELGILRKISHPNIIALLEDYETPSDLYLVMELIKGGDLFDAIAETNKYTERDASGMLYNLSSALKYLHSNDIVHRDIKPENLMICEHEDGTRSLKLGDFGLATEIHQEETLHTVCGTPTYVAPEVIAEEGYGRKVDVWSAGVITYILLCGFPPFVSPSNDQDDLFDRIIEGRFRFPSPYWDEVSESAKELLRGMLDKDPDTRLSAAQVVDHPWVSILRFLQTRKFTLGSGDKVLGQTKVPPLRTPPGKRNSRFKLPAL